MARRRNKKRTHIGAQNGTKDQTTKAASSADPKSMVIRIGAGEVGPSVSALAKDFRLMMEPSTASRLKERRSNRLRDYITMAGPLGVSHLLLFSRSSTGNTNLRMALAPRGPTLHFRVEKYSLCKDVMRSQNHSKGGGKEYQNPPLLVMNNFVSQPRDGNESPVPKHLEQLTTSVFQSLFPPLNPQQTPLSSIQRVLLVNREPETTSQDGVYIINLRHYAITTKKVGLSKSMKRLSAAEKLQKSQLRKGKGVPDLGKLHDVADFVLKPGPVDGGYSSTSESEIETDAEVEVQEDMTRKVLNKKQRQHQRAQAAAAGANGHAGPHVERRAVKLVELGPRMKLRLMKVEEGLCTGKIMWHEYAKKTQEEEEEMDKVWDQRRKEKEQRKAEQRENVARKKASREPKTGKDGQKGDEMDVDDVDEELWDSEDSENDDQMKTSKDVPTQLKDLVKVPRS